MVRDQGRDAKNAKLTISRVATEGGVNVETVRYYQRRGCWNSLLSPWEVIGTIPKKSCSGFVSSKGRKRSDLVWTKWPNYCSWMLQTHARRVVTWRIEKLAVIDQKIAELAAMRRALAKLRALCDKNLRRGACPIIKALQREPRSRYTGVRTLAGGQSRISSSRN